MTDLLEPVNSEDGGNGGHCRLEFLHCILILVQLHVGGVSRDLWRRLHSLRRGNTSHHLIHDATGRPCILGGEGLSQLLRMCKHSPLTLPVMARRRVAPMPILL